MSLKIKVKNHIRPLTFTETVTDVFIYSVQLGRLNMTHSTVFTSTLLCVQQQQGGQNTEAFRTCMFLEVIKHLSDS